MSTQKQPLNQGDRIYYRYGKHHQHLRNCVGTTPEGKDQDAMSGYREAELSNLDGPTVTLYVGSTRDAYFSRRWCTAVSDSFYWARQTIYRRLGTDSCIIYRRRYTPTNPLETRLLEQLT